MTITHQKPLSFWVWFTFWYTQSGRQTGYVNGLSTMAGLGYWQMTQYKQAKCIWTNNNFFNNGFSKSKEVKKGYVKHNCKDKKEQNCQDEVLNL